MPNSRRLFLVLTGCLVLFSARDLKGQSTGGSINGLVKDQSGPVPQATVQITSAVTGQRRSTSTGDDGSYNITEIPPGSYKVRVTASGYNPAEGEIQVSVAQVAKLADILLSPATTPEKVVVVPDTEMAERSLPTLSTSFTTRQIEDLPILTRDPNNLALEAPGVFSVRTFSFANTLVPFAVNGSRGRDNNFIIDSVDNNEPLFGGAATQFTNTDLFSEYRILTNQYQAEYGRNSGSVVNIITKQGGNAWHGTSFWFGQDDRFNAMTFAEKLAGLKSPAPFYENQGGGTLGGPVKKDHSWVFLSYQWDRARNDLSSVYPVVATLPTSTGLAMLQGLNPAPNSPLAVLLSDPTVQSVAALESKPCGNSSSGLPTVNPCTVGSANVNGAAVPFGTYLVPRGNVFDVRDHQLSGRWDQKLSERDTVYARYLFDDLLTPKTAFDSPDQTGFADFGLLPQWRSYFAQRTENAGFFWTHAWARKLNELRFSYSRIFSTDGPINTRAQGFGLPAVTVVDNFAFNANTAGGGTQQATNNFITDFPAAGTAITVGSDSRSSRFLSNVYQLQENFSVSLPRHTLKFGADAVRTLSSLQQISGDLGHYFFGSFSDFVNNGLGATAGGATFQRFGNFNGKGGEALPIREWGQFYFLQDDIRVSTRFTLNLGLRYENYSPSYNSVVTQSDPTLGLPKISRVMTNLAPRTGFAWGIDSSTVLRGGYGIYYNPIFFNIALLSWQSGPVSPLDYCRITPNPNTGPVSCVASSPSPYPSAPFQPATLADFAPNNENRVVPNLSNPYVHSWSLSLQRQVGKDFLFETAYVGTKGERLFQRLQLSPPTGSSGAIDEVSNSAYSDYHALQTSATKRLRRSGFWNGLAITGAYTWSHMTDNASEIFGPGGAFSGGQRLGTNINGFSQGFFGQLAGVEAITPFPQDSTNAGRAEHGNSSFDRRHRASVSFLWALPSPSSSAARAVFGNWEWNGLFTLQSGQPFTPLNAGLFSPCVDANQDGILTNDRPSIGNTKMPLGTVALLKDCTNPSAGYTTDPATAHFVQNPPGVVPYQPFTVTVNGNTETFIAGSAGRNILVGPRLVNLDFSALKSFRFGERKSLQFRAEFYDILNHANPGYPFGNVFTANAQLTPAIAYGPTGTPARATGATPENSIDAKDAAGNSLFLSHRFMNASARHIQFGLKLTF